MLEIFLQTTQHQRVFLDKDFFCFLYHYQPESKLQYIYTYNTTPLNWNTARGACQKRGGDLANVLTQDQQDEITSHITFEGEGTSAEWWIGLKQEKDTQNGADEWRWSTSTPM